MPHAEQLDRAEWATDTEKNSIKRLRERAVMRAALLCKFHRADPKSFNPSALLEGYSRRGSGVDRRRCDGRRYSLGIYRTEGQVRCRPSERCRKNTQVQRLRCDVGVLRAAAVA